jgi:hypothetical protein
MNGLSRFLVVLVLVTNSSAALAQDSRPREAAALGKVKFSVPVGFQLQRSPDSELAIMKAGGYEGGLFVATSGSSTPSEDDLITLSRRLVAELFPQQRGFSWKVLSKASIPKLNAHQRNQFVVKAVNENKFVQAEFVLVRLAKKNLLVGLVTQFGSEKESRFLYEVDGTEYSFQGWRGLYALLDSIKAF